MPPRRGGAPRRHGRGGEHRRLRRRAAQPEVAQARVEQQLAPPLTQGLHRRLRLLVGRARHVARLQRRVHLRGQLGIVDEESRALGLHEHVVVESAACAALHVVHQPLLLGLQLLIAHR
eukprot:scaffold110296_cov69-Phaeocystis_antarctica.AAC.1